MSQLNPIAQSAIEAAQVNVLLIDDSEDDYILTCDWLAEVPGTQYQIHWAGGFEEGLKAYTESKTVTIAL